MIKYAQGTRETQGWNSAQLVVQRFGENAA